MSTRCQIIVKGSDVVVYRHSDGYPDGKHGVVAALKKIVMPFLKHRGLDTCYLPAHIVAGMIAEHKQDMDKLIRLAEREGRHDYVSSYEQSKYLGFGVEAYNEANDNALHGDIEFLYIVDEKGIEVRAADFRDDQPCNVANTKHVKTVKFATRTRQNALTSGISNGVQYAVAAV